MEKPRWKVRSSEYLVRSPYMRLRKDTVELPNGTVIEDYFVRESDGFTIVVALTNAGKAVVTREYRYGADSIGYELPAGTINGGEDPLACASRELREETGYEAASFELIGTSFAEPVRSNSQAYVFLARGAQPTAVQSLDAGESIAVEEVSLEELRAIARDGRMHSIAAIAAVYLALEHASP
jgi:8-oxo-dGTP pyrophosphatase MutT (NUDIX family)